MTSLRDNRIGVIGAGAIGGVLIERLISGAEVPASSIVACETHEGRREDIGRRLGVRTTANPMDAASVDILVLCVPPLEVTKTLSAVRDQLGRGALVVSFAAAVPLDLIESIVPNVAVVRINPNSPLLVGEGFNPVTYGTHAVKSARGLADQFLTALGKTVEIADAQMNLYTALTAVGPTYYLPVLDAMIAAGVDGGLTREAAVQAATQTAIGTALLVAKRPEDPEHLKLFTGLRPLRDAEVRELVKLAIADAVSRMAGAQQKVTGSSGTA